MNATMNQPLPALDGRAGRNALAAWMRDKSILGALSSLHRDLGDIFRIPLPNFDAVILAGADANHFVCVAQRANLHWGMYDDPVSKLLRNGLLMQDGTAHDELRAVMNPPLRREQVARYVQTFVDYTDELSAQWDAAPRDMLVEIRRLALFVLMRTLFGVDVRPRLDEIWQPLLRALEYISPSLWLVWKNAPRRAYRAALAQLDAFLYALIRARRQEKNSRGDLLDHLIDALGKDDELMRDQLLTMLIAGHDTSTALLAWTLSLFAQYPKSQRRAQQEIDAVLGDDTPRVGRLGDLKFLEAVIQESLRLYPPIHLGNRRAVNDLEFQHYTIPRGTRVLYSIYLSHRDPRYWSEPNTFLPERFTPECRHKPPPFAYLPFGAGPRFCIGAAFAQTEAKVILARLLQQFEFELLPSAPHPHMGATLEPRPRVLMRARRR